ncbi:uncharacterized protein LOC6560983 [Drosophila grimshawi]|uniref:GH20709 n=1 Tax=Drosophila grimshawi TaxID=7222 RepID=B4J6Z9_DROGR|nr:uncharacterized protein LOC6560983 [Drosophila grimshawi]EDW00987.1 GH20709 [Drosophila grimshawi]
MCSLKHQFYTLAVALSVGLLGLVSALPQRLQYQPQYQQQQYQQQQVQQLQDVPHTLLDIETPNQFSYNSPLAQPDSLRSKPYFDFLSTLYAHDSAKTDLFRNRPRRDLQSELKTQQPLAVAAAADRPVSHRRERKRRAIVFRPLFVYQQREIKKKEIAARRRSDETRRRRY